jgi:hypothetical protein
MQNNVVDAPLSAGVIAEPDKPYGALRLIVSGRTYPFAPAKGFGPRIATSTICGPLSYLRC